MNSIVVSTNTFFSISVILGQLFFITLVFLFLVSRKKEAPNPWFSFFTTHGFLFAYSTVIVSLLGSFFYSEIVGFPPCILCLIQRGLFFGEFIIFTIAIFQKNKKLFLQWSLGFAIVGGIVAAYNALLQIGFSGFSFCDVGSNGVSCAQRFIMDFGYITIPVMALTAFLLNIIFILYALYFTRAEKEHEEKNDSELAF